MSLVAGWAGVDRPDFASINMSEPGPDALAATLGNVGVEVEGGVWTTDDADRLASSQFGTKVIRILVEPQEESPEEAVATAAAIEETLSRHGLDAPRVHHAEGMATWAVIRAAILLGRDIRVGLEDTTVLPDGSTAGGNGELVTAALRIAAEAGHGPTGTGAGA
jgi:uncharacterized protein (DUF849 family)